MTSDALCPLRDGPMPEWPMTLLPAGELGDNRVGQVDAAVQHDLAVEDDANSAIMANLLDSGADVLGQPTPQLVLFLDKLLLNLPIQILTLGGGKILGPLLEFSLLRLVELRERSLR